MFHLRGDLIDHDTLASRADLLGTTSPSVLLYAGMDGWRRQMVLEGYTLMSRALDLAASVREEIESIDGMHVNDADTTERLLAALRDFARHAPSLPRGPEEAVPAPAELRMEQARLPRDAYFHGTEDVPVEQAVGRVAAEMITPYPRASRWCCPASG